MQAEGQGRHYYILAWTLSQLSYLGANTTWLSVVRISTALIVSLTFFQMLKNLFNENFALLTSFCGLMLFQTAGGQFNSFHGTQIWYSVVLIFLLLSLTSYAIDLKQKRSGFKSFFYFFVSLHFYESMLLYTPVFFSMHLIYFIETETSFKLKRYIVNAFKSLKWLFLFIGFYFLLYLTFRQFFPSGYEGSKQLNFINLHRTLRTIYRFSINGISHNFNFNLEIPSPFYAILLSLFVALGVFIFFLNKKPASVLKKQNVIIWSITLLTLIYSLFAPNILYGFVDKYHSWVEGIPYYNGTFLSAFAHITLISFLTFTFFYFIKNNKILISLGLILSISSAIITFSNAKSSYIYFQSHKILSYRWDLSENIISQSTNQFTKGDLICTDSLYNNQDSFDLYDYWSLYYSERLNKTVKVSLVKLVQPECSWMLKFIQSDQEVSMVLTKTKDQNIEFTSKLAL